MKSGVYLVHSNDSDAFIEAVKLKNMTIRNMHKNTKNDEIFFAFSITENNEQVAPWAEIYPVSKMKKWSQKKILV